MRDAGGARRPLMKEYPPRRGRVVSLLFVGCEALNPAQYRVAWVVVVVDAGAQVAEKLAGLVAVGADVHCPCRAEYLMDDARRRKLHFVVAFTPVAAVTNYCKKITRRCFQRRAN